MGKALTTLGLGIVFGAMASTAVALEDEGTIETNNIIEKTEFQTCAKSAVQKEFPHTGIRPVKDFIESKTSMQAIDMLAGEDGMSIFTAYIFPDNSSDTGITATLGYGSLNPETQEFGSVYSLSDPVGDIKGDVELVQGKPNREEFKTVRETLLTLRDDIDACALKAKTPAPTGP